MFPSRRSLRLTSEFKPVAPQALSFSLSPVVKTLIDTWFEELYVRITTKENSVKLKSFFKSNSSRASLKPYQTKDQEFPSEAIGSAPLHFSWLPLPDRTYEMQERDVISLETNARSSVRALNFMELLLQAIHNIKDDPEMFFEILGYLSRAVKATLQIQVAQVCNITLFRRDHFISTAKGLSKDQVINLRSGSIIGAKRIFSEKLLSEINTSNKDSLQARAFSRLATGRFFQQGNNYNNKQHDRGKQSTNNFQRGGFRNNSNDRGRYNRSQSPERPVATLTLDSNTVLSQDWSEEKIRLSAMQTIPVGGRLIHTAHLWKGIGASKKICRWLRRGYRLPFMDETETQARSLFTSSSPTDRMPNYAPNSEKFLALNMMIDTLLKKNAIIEMKTNETGFFNLVFLRPKKHDASETRLEKKWRLILDVSSFNKFIIAKPFKMETVQKIRSSIIPGLFATSIDLTDAYHHIPIHPNYQNFLAFQVHDRKFKYIAMPFGLSSAPQVFTEVMTAIKLFARRNFGGFIFQYLDDWLLLDRSPIATYNLTKKFVDLCITQGMVVNLDKSHLSPSSSLVHLGTKWNFENNTVAIPDDRIRSIAETASYISRNKRALLSKLESLMGTLVSVEKLVHTGRINYRAFQSVVIRNLKYGRRPRYISLHPQAIKDLLWWSEPSNFSRPVPCVMPKQDIIIQTDASNEAWGASSDFFNLTGRWSPEELFLHINHKELLVILKVLEAKYRSLRNLNVLFLMDNTTAVSYILKQGGTHSPNLTRSVRRIFYIATENSITLNAKHLRGDLNVLADMLSRPNTILKTEWMLSEENFLWVCNQSPWGAPTTDLFANKFNSQLPRYMSPCPDENAVAIDALVAHWPREVLYCFPPTTIMEEVIRKIQQERPEKLLLVAPNWPNTVWNSTLKKICLRWRLIPSINLWQPMSKWRHPSPLSGCLALWLISYQDSPTEVTLAKF